MVDTRPRAREKALKRAAELKAQRDALRENNPVQTERPPSAGFESERQRTKNALKDELGTYDGTGVHKITASAEQRQEERVLNVAAYCRVSTDDIEQTVSIEMQKRNYRDTIRNHPGWRFSGLYVDEAYSGTKDDRPRFVQLVKDCKDGKIDRIITKSISRFARNTVTLLTVVRDLRRMGIGIYFEKQNIYTLDGKGEVLLTIFFVSHSRFFPFM